MKYSDNIEIQSVKKAIAKDRKKFQEKKRNKRLKNELRNYILR